MPEQVRHDDSYAFRFFQGFCGLSLWVRDWIGTAFAADDEAAEAVEGRAAGGVDADPHRPPQAVAGAVELRPVPLAVPVLEVDDVVGPGLEAADPPEVGERDSDLLLGRRPGGIGESGRGGHRGEGEEQG